MINTFTYQISIDRLRPLNLSFKQIILRNQVRDLMQQWLLDQGELLLNLLHLLGAPFGDVECVL